MNKLVAALFCIISLTACKRNEETPLAFIGPQEIVGDKIIYHSIPEFKLSNQEKDSISNANLDGKVYIADFFFTTCPSICPIMTNNMVKIQRAFKGNENFALVSHTVNPENDNEEVLKDYAAEMHADTKNWHFLTGEKEEIYQTAFSGYFANADEDELAPGGFLHSQYFILVDKQGRVRSGYDRQGNVKGVYDGTNDQDVLQLIGDIKTLLKEQ